MARDIIRALTEALGRALVADGWRLGVAESCTGGGLAYRLTELPGSSDWFERGFVTYSNAAKTSLLGVSDGVIAMHGAVSAEVAEAMARGVLDRAPVNLSVAITGIAGPGGARPGKPVGTVFIAVAADGHVDCRRHWFTGDRDAVRRQSIEHALRALIGLREVFKKA
ncbi:MAG: CinA family protein [Acidiferrobacteraceae bacterium]